MGQFTVCFAHQHAAADSESCLIWAAAAAAQWATRVADVEGVVRLLPACPPVPRGTHCLHGFVVSCLI